MIEQLEIRHLKTLDALYKFGNISSAAEYLNVSQQAISFQLKKIRVILNDRLFVRTGHGVTPTPYAKLIELHIYKVLTHLNNIPLPGSIIPSKIEKTLVKKLRTSAPNVKIIAINIESVNLTKKMH
ncbi:helix-turn-helix domain-containing protein [Zooshikella harenae]|uniref:helix-turn-helix domain-containing protein n=1 Tax=Zooshikella harenae TaxID=2827238 RepID=UPI001E4DA15F|nr:LysR family transcriptional regulator [Zooshikella harenae]